MARETYEAQVAFLVRVLTHVVGKNVFALKTGTAINPFYRDLAQSSVDLDGNFGLADQPTAMIA